MILKKLVSSIVAVAMVAAMSTTVFATEMPDTIPSYITFASDVVESYFRNRELGESNDISPYMSKELFGLLNTKVELANYQNAKLNIIRNNYNIQVIPFNEAEWIIANDTVFMELQVIREWNYDESVGKSTSSDVLEITLDKNSADSYLMNGCYTLDGCTRFGNLDEDYLNSLKQKSGLNFLSEYENTYKAECDTKAQQMESDTQMSQKADKYAQTFSNNLVRDSIRKWSRENYNKNEPTSSTTSVPYYDFSAISGNYDCTNFAPISVFNEGKDFIKILTTPIILTISAIILASFAIN